MAPFLTNYTTQSHRARFKEWIRTSDDVFIAVAFLKCAGLLPLIAEFRELLERGGKFTAVIGTDFWLTEPAALNLLFQLTIEHSGCKLLMFKPSATSTFHPKFYRFISHDRLRVVIGSANLTGGGLAKNIEISAAYLDSLPSDLAQQSSALEDQILTDPRCHKPTGDELRKYEAEHAVFEKARKQAERKAKQELVDIVILDEATLQAYLTQYLDDTEQRTDLRQRTNNYKEAKALIYKTLLAKRNIDEKEFRKVYGALVGEKDGKKLWHSGSVYRSKNKVIPQYALVQTMTRAIAAKLDRPPQEMFQLGMEWMKKIDGLGPNVFTEICNTLRPDRFAVLNKNPTTSLLKLGRGSFPNPASFKPGEYHKYCDELGRLRDACGFKDFGETDHFLNFIYWATRKKNSVKDSQ